MASGPGGKAKNEFHSSFVASLYQQGGTQDALKQMGMGFGEMGFGENNESPDDSLHKSGVGSPGLSKHKALIEEEEEEKEDVDASLRRAATVSGGQQPPSGSGRHRQRSLADARMMQRKASMRALVHTKTQQSRRNLGLGSMLDDPNVAANSPSPRAAAAAAAPEPPEPPAASLSVSESSRPSWLADLDALFAAGQIDEASYHLIRSDTEAMEGGGGGGGGGSNDGGISSPAHDPPQEAAPPPDLGRTNSHGMDDDLVLQQYRIQAQRDAAALVRRRVGFDPLRATKEGVDQKGRRLPLKKDGGSGSGDKKATVKTETRVPKMREGRALPAPRPVGAAPAARLGRPYLSASKPSAPSAAPSGAGGSLLRRESMNERADGIVVLDSSPPTANGGSSADVGGSGGMSDALFASELSRLLAAGKVKLDEGERVVRCMGCRSGLRVGRGAALVDCPVCGTVSPGTTAYGEGNRLRRESG